MKTIREIYECSPWLEKEPLAQWHNELIEKTISEFTELDTARCIRNEIYMDAAAESMMRYLLKDPLAGGQYEGELIELAGDMDELIMARHVNALRGVIIRAEEVLYEKEWESPEDRDTFFRSGVNLRRFLQTDSLLDVLSATDDETARNQVAKCLGDMHCDRAVEPLIELITDPDIDVSKGPMIFALQNLNISVDQLISLLPFIGKGNLEEKETMAELLKANLCRLDEQEMKHISGLLQEMIEERE